MKIFLILFILIFSVQGTDKPNIIFIYTDDHGYADLGCQGIVDDVKTPFIDELAKGGVRMTSGYSTATQCCPSRAGLMTGRYQTRFDFESNFECPLPLTETTVATYLLNAGYETFHVGKWHLAANQQSYKFALENSGVDVSKMSSIEIKRAASKIPKKEFMNIIKGPNKAYHPDKRGFKIWGNQLGDQKRYHLDLNNEESVKFIDKNYDKPFFMYVAHRAPHVPLAVTERYLKRFPGEMPERRRKALAMISCMDDGVGMILEALRKYNLEEKTIIFFMSDNGAPYKKHKEDAPGDAVGWDGSLNDPWTGEKGMLTEGGIRLPYLVYWKGKIKPQVYDHPVITLDATATALSLAGVKPTKPLDGINLIPYLIGEKSSAPNRDLFWRWRGQRTI
ncbi:MAG: sulfatase-like hydrolase/transferase, partial [Lentisphaerales bacterium]|nr:sulfatase-like hydrolase/transferase [Lentisphaerales bacterium]